MEVIVIAITDVMMLVYAFAMAKQNIAVTYPFRKIAWDAAKKKVLLKTMHLFNGIITTTIAAGFATVSFTALHSYVKGACIFCVCLLLHSLVFDIVYAKGIGEKWYYLGSATDNRFKAKLDRLFTWLFKNGKIKALVFVITVIVLHLIFYYF